MTTYGFETNIGRCALSWSVTRDALTAFHLPARTESGMSAMTAGTAEFSAVPDVWRQLADRVRRHLAGELQDFADVALEWTRVSEFQRAVLAGALRCKAGDTWTYGRLAREIGQPVAASRAVGTALGRNPWPLIVPCHRFVGADGRMTGFSGPGGIETKLRLLAIERAQLFST